MIYFQVVNESLLNYIIFDAPIDLVMAMTKVDKT